MLHRILTLFGVLMMPVAGAAQPLPEGAIAWLGAARLAAPRGNGLALSPDGKHLVGGSTEYLRESPLVYLWDADSGKLLRQTETDKNPSVPYRTHFTWSADGKLIAGIARTGGPPFHCFQVWHADTLKRLLPEKEFPASDDGIYEDTAFRFIANDQYVARLGKTYEKVWRVVLWKVFTRQVTDVRDIGTKAAMLKPGEVLHHVALSPSGELMAMLTGAPEHTNDAKSTVHICKTETGALVRTLRELPQAFRLDLADEGDTLVLHPLWIPRLERIQTGQAAVVDARTGRVKFHCPFRFQRDDGIHERPDAQARWIGRRAMNQSSLRFRDSLLICDEVGLTRLDFKSGKKLEELDAPVTNLAMSADGRRIAIRREKRIGVSDDTLKVLHMPDVLAQAPSLRYLPDGRLITMDAEDGDSAMLTTWDARKQIHLEAKRVCRSFDVIDVGYDGRNMTMVRPSGSGEKLRMVTYDMATNEAVHAFGPMDLTNLRASDNRPRVRLSEDGKRLLAMLTEEDRFVIRWFDARSGQKLGQVEVPWAKIQPMTDAHGFYDAAWLSADGSSFGYVDLTGKLNVVDCAKGQVVLAPTIATSAKGLPEKAPPWLARSAGQHRLLWAKPLVLPESLRKVFAQYNAPQHDPSSAEHALWDRKGRLVRRFRLAPEDTERDELLSPDGRSIIVRRTIGDSNTELVLFETATSRVRGRIPIRVGDSFLSFLRRADFSPDSTTLATSSYREGKVLLWDLARSLAGKPVLPPPQNAGDALRLWEVLGDPDPVEADRALWALAAVPEHTLPLFKERLRPARPADDKRLQALILQLDSALFAERAAASKELQREQDTALPAVQRARPLARSLEHRRRIDEVIDYLQSGIGSAGPLRCCLREIRALQVLERIGGTEAREQIQSIAAGLDGALMTTEAQLILARWPNSP